MLLLELNSKIHIKLFWAESNINVSTQFLYFVLNILMTILKVIKYDSLPPPVEHEFSSRWFPDLSV